MANKFVRDVKEVVRRLRNRGISFEGNRQYPAIPTIDDTVESHTNALRAIREAMETHERRNQKAALDSFVRLYELEDVLGGFVPGETSGVTWATCEEITAGAPEHKAIDPVGAACALDRLRAPGQHEAGKGTETVVVTPVATVATIDGNLSNVFHLTLTDATTTIANPTNPINGQTINFHLEQDVSGGRLVTWGSQWKFVNRITPVLSTDAGAIDLVSGQWNEINGIMECSFLPDFGIGSTEPAPPTASDLVFVNVGGGNEVYKDVSGLNVNLRTLIGSGAIEVSTSGDTIVINYTPPDVASVPLSGLTDVDLTDLAVDDLLRWDGEWWVPYTPGAVVDLTGVPFLTVDDQTALLGSSRRLVAGDNITLDLTDPATIVITAAAMEGGGAGGGYPEELGYSGI